MQRVRLARPGGASGSSEEDTLLRFKVYLLEDFRLFLLFIIFIF